MSNITGIEKGFRWAAIPVGLISAYFTYMFAFSTMSDPFMGRLLGAALAICALCSGYVWTLRSVALRSGVSKGTAVLFLSAGVMFTGSDALTNAGSLLWQRAASSNKASVQNVRYDDARKAVEEAKDRITFFTTRIDALKDKNPWVTLVSADGLRAKLVALEEKRRQEERNGGCGPICLSVMDEIAGTNERIGTAEKLGKHESMLAAAHKGLKAARHTAKNTNNEVSATDSHALALATGFTLSLNPSKEARHWTTYAVGLVLAVFLTFGPMSMNWIGYGVWREVTKTPTPAPGARRTNPLVSQHTSGISHPVPDFNRDLSVYDQIIAASRVALGDNSTLQAA